MPEKNSKWVENTVGKRRNCLFSKDLYCRPVKNSTNQDLFGKGLKRSVPERNSSQNCFGNPGENTIAVDDDDDDDDDVDDGSSGVGGSSCGLGGGGGDGGVGRCGSGYILMMMTIR